MNYKSFYSSRVFKTAALVLVLAAVTVTVILVMNTRHRDSVLPATEEKKIRPLLMHNIKDPVCFDIDDKGNFIIGSGTSIYIVSEDGSPLASADTGQTVKAVCRGPGIIYTAAGNSLYKTDNDGNFDIEIMADLGSESIVTNLEYKNGMLTAADAGSCLLYRFSFQGVLKKIFSFENEPSLYLPSPYFDSAALSDGRFWITNTGNHQIDLYSASGEYIKSCKKSEKGSLFEGCCNPVRIEIIDTGRLVTYEKGIKRLKFLDFTGNIIREIYTKTIFRIDEELLDMKYKNGSLYMLAHDSIYQMEGL